MESKIEIGLFLGWGIMFVIVTLLIFFVLNYRAKLFKLDKEKQLFGIKAAIEAEERQKERIANDLHDDILPLFTVLALNVRMHKRKAESRNEDVNEFDDDLDIVEKAIQGMRDIAFDLIPTTFLNFGLLKALEQFATQLHSGEIVVEFHNSQPVKELPFSKNEQINIYRIYKEVLTNLKKHAQYTCLTISVESNSNEFKLLFEHDGKGVSNSEIDALSQSSIGLGLKSLKTRLLILKGSINYTDANGVPLIQLIIPFEK